MSDHPFIDSIIIGTAVGILILQPWLLLAAGAFCGWKWWKKWRFKDMNLAEKKTILDTRGWSYFDIEKEKLMYLGTTEDGTIRWWFGDDDWIMPQAIDNGEFYWSKRIQVKDPTLLRHLKGFYEMGNEWPEYYKIISKKEPTKKVYKKSKDKNHTWVDAANIKVVPSDLPRADYADAGSDVAKYAATATISAIDQNNAQLMDLAKTVEELEKEVHGRCPKIDFSGTS